MTWADPGIPRLVVGRTSSPANRRGAPVRLVPTAAFGGFAGEDARATTFRCGAINRPSGECPNGFHHRLSQDWPSTVWMALPAPEDDMQQLRASRARRRSSL
jgi:hypothetical protein